RHVSKVPQERTRAAQQKAAYSITSSARAEQSERNMNAERLGPLGSNVEWVARTTHARGGRHTV
ncbi:MAG TPA: hypothetical protein VEN78_25250, partial [Bradyrhizobium sp.]|nr:hypothetical protein [Bradyrhizobium sp.]